MKRAMSSPLKYKGLVDYCTPLESRILLRQPSTLAFPCRQRQAQHFSHLRHLPVTIYLASIANLFFFLFFSLCARRITHIPDGEL